MKRENGLIIFDEGESVPSRINGYSREGNVFTPTFKECQYRKMMGLIRTCCGHVELWHCSHKLCKVNSNVCLRCSINSSQRTNKPD
jgi:hypothetical protein